MQGGQNFETFNLAPFIIPVMRQGELVFFKLTVELIVPDMNTKQQLKKREAWVRDAIYTELKGIEVGPGTKGEFLLNYRRPLKQRIEKELAPLEIRDVRLMGYVLK
jgi:flagellar basal body-associated protein FliL